MNQTNGYIYIYIYIYIYSPPNDRTMSGSVEWANQSSGPTNRVGQSSGPRVGRRPPQRVYGRPSTCNSTTSPRRVASVVCACVHSRPSSAHAHRRTSTDDDADPRHGRPPARPARPRARPPVSPPAHRPLALAPAPASYVPSGCEETRLDGTTVRPGGPLTVGWT